MVNTIQIAAILILLIGLLIFGFSLIQKRKLIQEQLQKVFPEAWRETLKKRILFYDQLNEEDKVTFEKRTQLFLATKNILGIETEVDDEIRIMVAASAIIPTFAFPNYNYPKVTTILIYPNSFDRKFQTKRYPNHKEFIAGLVNGNSQNNTIILSKPDLVSSFEGIVGKENVGIHEFVHMLDKEDGEIDGIPGALMNQRFAGPWLHEIKKEMKRIEENRSDINPYALTNNAEFLAVVSEYFFSNSLTFSKKHPELYKYLSMIYNGKGI